MHLDDAVGRIVAALEKKGVRERTMLVFTSDNGGSTVENNDLQYPDDKCPDGKLTGNNSPYRGQKGTLYEGGTRVATVVSWPGRIKPGKVETPLQIIDWMPTFAALAGYKPERDLKWDGIDITKVLIEHAPLADRALYAVAPGWRGRSVRFGNWKLIVSGEGEKRTVELYDVQKDPSESNNDAERQPERVAQLAKMMDDLSSHDRDAVAND
jgi:arylsulfatase A-like enzyme